MANDETNPPSDETKGRILETAEHVGRDLLVAIVERLKAQKKPFTDLSEGAQNDVIMGLTAAIRQGLHRGFALIVGGGFPHAQATLDKVGFSPKGVQGTLSLAGGSEYRHALSDHVGRPVIVVLASAEAYLATMGEVRADPDQRQLELPASDDTSGFDKERFETDGGAGGTDADDDGIPPPDTAVVDAHPGELTIEVVHDMLAMAGAVDGREWDAATISGWDQATRKLVVDFCGAVVLKEQGQDVVVPARPDVLGEGSP